MNAKAESSKIWLPPYVYRLQLPIYWSIKGFVKYVQGLRYNGQQQDPEHIFLNNSKEIKERNTCQQYIFLRNI